MSSGYVSDRRTSDFDNNLDYCFTVLQNSKRGIEVNMFCFCDKVIHFGSLIIISVTVSLRFGVGVGVLALDFISRRVSPCRNVIRRMHHFYDQVPEIKCGDSVHARTIIPRDHFRFCLAV